MKKAILSSVFALFSACAVAQVVVENGVSAHGVIAVPAASNSVEDVAAAELQSHIRRATGVSLPIVRVTGSEALQGKCGYRLGRAAAIKPHADDVADSCRYSLSDGFLDIAGVDGEDGESGPWNPAGTLFGVYEYLHNQLGVRWLWPGETGIYVPKRGTLSLTLPSPAEYKPVLQFASIQGARYSEQNPDMYRWSRRVLKHRSANGYKYAGRAGHAFEDWGEKYGKEHPEWFCLINGKRQYTKRFNLCVSNPEVQDQIVRNWQELQAVSPRRLSVNVKENDNTLRCQCENCKAWDGADDRGPTGRYQGHVNVSDRYCRFALEVQKKAAAIDPAATVGFYAYQGYFKAPRKTKMNAGCQVGLVPDIPFPRRAEYTAFLRHEYDLWKASGATLYLRPNYFLGGYTMPEVWYNEFADEFAYLMKLGIAGYGGDALGGQFASNGINFYVACRLIDEPSADPEALFREYTDAFGAAAPEIAAYLKHWQNYTKENEKRLNDIHEELPRKWYFHGWHYYLYAHRAFPIDELKKGLPYLERAAKLAAGDKDALAKVAFLRSGLEHAMVCCETSAVFADTKAGRDQRIAAYEKLEAFRKTLPPFAGGFGTSIRREGLWQLEGRETVQNWLDKRAKAAEKK